IDLKIFQRQQHALVRFLTLPETHPLARQIDRIKDRPVRSVPGPIHLLFRAYPDLAEASVVRQLPRPVPGENELLLVASVAGSKEEALQEHERTLADTIEEAVHVYTDGSGLDGRFGAASFVLNGHVAGGEYDPIQIPMGTRTTVYRAEATALHQVLVTLPTEQPAYVWSDSKALLLAINAGLARDPMIRAIQERWRELGDIVKIGWIPGHWDIVGNEGADERAKEAARMECEDGRDEAATLRLAATRRMRTEWERRWEEGTKGRAFRKVNRLRVGEAKRLYRGVSRAKVSVMVQLLTGHLGLNKYLRWRKVKLDAQCDRCHELETREHLL
ncbi:hypothetical protein CF328_g9629, partial [Tilletia controversa]